MGQKHTGSPKIHGGGHTGLMGKQAAPSRLGGGVQPGVSRSVASQLLLKSTVMGGFTEISHKATEDGTGNSLL